MDEKATVRLIQKYRHDLMNRLQIVSGYLSMGKVDKAKMSLDNVLAFYEEERQLMRLNTDTFVIWILKFQDTYPLFSLSYHVNLLDSTEKSIDEQELLLSCERLLTFLSKIVGVLQVYDLFLSIEEKETRWRVGINLKEVFLDELHKQDIEKQFGISVAEGKEQTSFKWTIAKEERGE